MRQKQKILEYVQERFRENDKTLLREIKDQNWEPDCASTLFRWQVVSALDWPRTWLPSFPSEAH